eukprot:EG_transcript_6860
MYGQDWLEVEPEWRCNSSTHRFWVIFAAVFAGIYAALLPIIALGILWRYQRLQLLASRECINTLGFLYRGYRRTRWFWEAFIHIRRLLIVAIVTAGFTSPLVQSYLALWLVSFWLLLNLVFVPYSHEFINKLENFSLATVFTTINLGLLHRELRINHIDGWAITANVFLIILNVICIVLFFLIFLQKIKVALYARFDVNGDGEITFWEVWQVLKERFGGRPPPPAEPTKEPEVWAGKVPEAEGKDLQTPAVPPDADDSLETVQLPSGAFPPMQAPGLLEKPEGQWYPGYSAYDNQYMPSPLQAGPLQPQYPGPFVPGAVNTGPDWYGGGAPYGMLPPNYDSFYPQKPQAPPLMPAEAYPEWSFSPPEKAKQADAWYGSGDVPGGYSEYDPSMYTGDDGEGTDGKPRTKLRVGLRAPENEERAKVTLLTDLYGHSCRSVYLYYCKQYDTKPKPQVRLALPDTPNEFDMEDLILNETTLIGNRGLLPVLELVRLNPRLRCLSVTGNGIKNTGVEWLVHMALDHPGLASVDLSDNRITNAAGTVLNYLAQRNPRIVDINIQNTRIDDQLKHHIEMRLKGNREQPR